ncbi:MAG: adenylate/guanylate cyclase with GAF sensor(s), partial [Coleofasciculus sp. S288]|nr:adenylate/guanylate cyclase with GAF sensor(s) [Coleofasciculus sp. S288]
MELQQKKEPSKIELDHLDESLETFHLLQSLTQAIGKAPDFHSALGVALRQVCEATQWEYGEAWLPSPDNAVLECSPAWYGNTKLLEQLRRTRETLTLPLNTGLPGRVWSSRQPV